MDAQIKAFSVKGGACVQAHHTWEPDKATGAGEWVMKIERQGGANAGSAFLAINGFPGSTADGHILETIATTLRVRPETIFAGLIKQIKPGAISDGRYYQIADSGDG